MTGRRIYVISSHPLLLKSLRVLLNHPEIEWVGLATDFVDLTAQISALQPDVILLEGEEIENAKRALQILATNHRNLRIIGLNMLDNEMSVFEAGQGVINKTDDLLRLILKE